MILCKVLVLEKQFQHPCGSIIAEQNNLTPQSAWPMIIDEPATYMCCIERWKQKTMLDWMTPDLKSMVVVETEVAVMEGVGAEAEAGGRAEQGMSEAPSKNIVTLLH